MAHAEKKLKDKIRENWCLCYSTRSCWISLTREQKLWTLDALQCKWINILFQD